MSEACSDEGIHVENATSKFKIHKEKKLESISKALRRKKAFCSVQSYMSLNRSLSGIFVFLRIISIKRIKMHT